MSEQTRPERIHMLDDFVCKAIPNPALPRSTPDRQGPDAGSQAAQEPAADDTPKPTDAESDSIDSR